MRRCRSLLILIALLLYTSLSGCESRGDAVDTTGLKQMSLTIEGMT